VKFDQAMQDDEVVMDVAQRSDADPQGPAVPYILGSALEPLVGSHPRWRCYIRRVVECCDSTQISGLNTGRASVHDNKRERPTLAILGQLASNVA
jgi:hypothetical protein